MRWRQYHKFTDVYIHRFIHFDEEDIEYIKEGWEYLEGAVQKKTGAILLMSHIGNWELAAQTLNKKGLPIMLYLGAKNKEQIEHIQKQILAKSGIRVVATSEDEKSPFALIEGINFLREGGIVSMTGDRLWGEQSYVTVNFMGHEVTPAGYAAFVCPDDRRAADDFFCLSGSFRKISYQGFAWTKGGLPPHARTGKKLYRNRRRPTPRIWLSLPASIPLSGIILSLF